RQMRLPRLTNSHLYRRQTPDLLGRHSFISPEQFVFHGFTVLERSKAVAEDAAEVDENVLPFRSNNEAEPFFRIEPFHLTAGHGVLRKMSPSGARRANAATRWEIKNLRCRDR